MKQKNERLEKENEILKKALKEIYEISEMSLEEQEEYLKKNHTGCSFYPYAVGVISSISKCSFKDIEKLKD